MATGEMYPTGMGGMSGLGERDVRFGEVFSVLWRPVEVLARVARRRQVLLGFGVVALAALLSLVNALISIATGAAETTLNDQQFRDLPPEVRQQVEDLTRGFVTVGGPVFSVLSPFLFWVLVSGLVWLAARMLGGRGPFSAMLAIVGVALVPTLVGSIVSIPITAMTGALGGGNTGAGVFASVGLGGIGLIVSLIVLVWEIALVIIGTRFAQNLDSYGRSGGRARSRAGAASASRYSCPCCYSSSSRRWARSPGSRGHARLPTIGAVSVDGAGRPRGSERP